MNYGRHLNFSYLTSLLDRNPLIHTSHLHISRFKSLQIPIQKYQIHFIIFDFFTQSKDCASWRRGSEVGFGADAGFDELEGATDRIAVSVFAEVLVEFDQKQISI